MIRCCTVLLVSLFASIGQAEEVCPWLNSATASGVLGGPATALVIHGRKNNDDSVCEYTSKNANATYNLHIAVVTMTNIQREFGTYLKQCGRSAVPVRAIGNEAVTCALSTKRGEQADQVISRVRDRALVVRISTNDPSANHESLREQARNVAEQVAGFLF